MHSTTLGKRRFSRFSSDLNENKSSDALVVDLAAIFAEAEKQAIDRGEFLISELAKLEKINTPLKIKINDVDFPSKKSRYALLTFLSKKKHQIIGFECSRGNFFDFYIGSLYLLFNSFTALESLTLIAVDTIGEGCRGVCDLIDGIAANPDNRLINLFLSDIFCNKLVIASLFRYFCSDYCKLQKLTFDNFVFEELNIILHRMLNTNLCKVLVELNVINARTSWQESLNSKTQTFDTLSCYLALPDCNLARLNISHCKLDKTNICTLLASLIHNTSLQQLSMNDCNTGFGGEPEELVEKLNHRAVRALSWNTTLQSLIIEDNGLYDFVIEGVANNSGLTELILKNAAITQEALLLLKNNKSLREFQVSRVLTLIDFMEGENYSTKVNCLLNELLAHQKSLSRIHIPKIQLGELIENILSRRQYNLARLCATIGLMRANPNHPFPDAVVPLADQIGRMLLKK